jgi:hypothetical protein
LQSLRILEPMYGDQVLLVMHHRLALVTLNLEQPAQEVPFTRKKNYENYTIFQIYFKKITINIYNREKNKK